MPARTMMEVHAALASASYDEILGCPEGRDIDFKVAPYLLDTPRGKWELAKDIAAFANMGGGLIVVGVRAERLENRLCEVATELRPVRKDMVDAGRYRDAIANGITPLVEGVELRWFPDSETSADAILTVYVPRQPERLKPFVLRRVVEPDGSQIPTFAIPRRNEDRTEWTSADHVQSQLAMMALLGSSGGLAAAHPVAVSRSLDDRLLALMRELDADAEPCVGLQLTAPGRFDLAPVLYGNGGIVETLRTWKGIRPMGFDLALTAPPENRGSEIVFGDSRWHGRLGVDASLDLVIPVRFDFLCWAMNKANIAGAPLRINPVPLVESILDFFRLAGALLVGRTPSSAWSLRIRAWRMKLGGVELAAGNKESWRRADVASSDDFAPPPFIISGKPEKDAFDALVRLYGLWGLGGEAIPFTANREIDPNAIISIR